MRNNHDPSRGALPFSAGSVPATIDDAILSRRSVRAFRPDPVPKELIEEILAVAGRAPSGTNVQPWKVTVLAGEVRDRVSARMVEAYLRGGERRMLAPYKYYPTKWREPYISRRRKIGWDLYGLLGIGREDKDKMALQHARNFRFFDAPVGLIFTIDRDLELGSWLDYGMFLQSVMLAARARGLDTCPQAAIAQAQEILREELQIPETEQVVCGMSLGYARDDAIENTLVTEREPVQGFVRFLGFR
jgi:nitroreductase